MQLIVSRPALLSFLSLPLLFLPVSTLMVCAYLIQSLDPCCYLVYSPRLFGRADLIRNAGSRLWAE